MGTLFFLNPMSFFSCFMPFVKFNIQCNPSLEPLPSLVHCFCPLYAFIKELSIYYLPKILRHSLHNFSKATIATFARNKLEKTLQKQTLQRSFRTTYCYVSYPWLEWHDALLVGWTLGWRPNLARWRGNAHPCRRVVKCMYGGTKLLRDQTKPHEGCGDFS